MKISKADYLRSWGITDPTRIKAGFTWLRYKNPPEKGIYWYYFAKMVRERDIEEWGACISCGRPIHEGGDAGHFIAASKCGPDLLFDPRNVNLECAQCNAWDETHYIKYEIGLDARYGKGTAQGLKARFLQYDSGGIQKDWTKQEFVDKLAELGIVQLPV